ncbi:MAG: ATP-dependent DNA helicase [Candidatus Thermoplasmatota archaeon]|nr:ATP-dependent DNA helicase [Candidatus Thermoplasmatota archaeon]
MNIYPFPMYETFPYTERENQEEIMDEIKDCLERGKSLVYQAATGSGKTVCTLTPTLDYALREEKKILYLTRTNSQQRQVLLELREIGEHYGLGVQGRNNTCLLAQEREELKEGDAEELSKYCSDRKKEVRTAINNDEEPTACPYYAGLLQADLDEMSQWFKDNIPTVDETMDFCRERKVCPYELTKALIPEATLVTAPYIYFFAPFIRKQLKDWMNVELSDLIVVVDEAHNLPDYARDLSSSEITKITLERAKEESREFGDPILQTDDPISSFCELFEDIILDTVDEFVVEEDGLIPPSEVRTELLHALGMNTNQLKGIIKDLRVQGEIVQEKRREEKKLPRSYINSLASFLSFWFSIEGEDYIKLVNGGGNPSLEAFCLDPSNVTSILNSCHSSIHQSATLEPLDEYRDSIGLPYDTESRNYPSPFPKENKALFYLDGVTTRHEEMQRGEDMKKKLREELEKILSHIDRNIVVFFPSYRLMGEIIEPIKLEKKDVFTERQGMDQPELMSMVNDFKEKGGVLFSVIGGRVSEGMDFPGEQLEVAVVVGIPYPKPTARQKGLKHYYDMKFNKGWEYTVKAPAVRKILQATGRLVRSEDDLGASVILDERGVHFKKYLEGLTLVEDIGSEIKEFFQKREETL